MAVIRDNHLPMPYRTYYGGYTGQPFADAVQNVLGAAVEIAKGNELHTSIVIPKRWLGMVWCEYWG